MNVGKFEAAGIALSIGVMALALWLLRVDSAAEQFANRSTEQDSAAVFVADSENRRAAIADAYLDAGGGDTTLERLIVDDVVIGTGTSVEEGDTVRVHLIGTLQNGQKFDDSYVKGEPYTLQLEAGKVIDGFREGIVGMKPGGQRVIVVPPEYGYGNERYKSIPANATLVYMVELLSIE